VIAFDIVFSEPDRLNPDVAADTFRDLDEETEQAAGAAGQRLVESHWTWKSGFASTTRERPHGVARSDRCSQRPQPASGFLVEVAKRVSRDVRIEPVGLGEYDVERDHDGTELGQSSDQISDPGPRPGKLPKFRQARFVNRQW